MQGSCRTIAGGEGRQEAVQQLHERGALAGQRRGRLGASRELGGGAPHKVASCRRAENL